MFHQVTKKRLHPIWTWNEQQYESLAVNTCSSEHLLSYITPWTIGRNDTVWLWRSQVEAVHLRARIVFCISRFVKSPYWIWRRSSCKWIWSGDSLNSERYHALKLQQSSHYHQWCYCHCSWDSGSPWNDPSYKSRWKVKGRAWGNDCVLFTSRWDHSQKSPVTNQDSRSFWCSVSGKDGCQIR